MQYADWRMLSSILMVLGLVFSIGGAWVWANTEGYMGWRSMSDYRQFRGYTAPLIIVGISFFVVGIALEQRSATQTAVPTPTSSTKKICANCGTEIPPFSKYCPKCGQKA